KGLQRTMNDTPLLYLSADDVRSALSMSEAIEVMRDAFAQLSKGEASLPTRECLRATDDRGVDLVMPCHSAASNMFSLKTATVFKDNPRSGLPAIQALLILTDGLTGSHLAIMDGTSLTAIRTGAASGLATDLLAPADASVASIFGSSVQARAQLEAVCSVRAIRRASVYSRNQAAASRFAGEMTDRLGLPVTSVRTPSENLSDADVICTATSSSRPVFSDSEIRGGVHINAVGAYRPDMAEVPADTVRRARVVVDHLDSAMEEAGDLLQPLHRGLIEQTHFCTELGEIVLNRSPGRRSADEITLFKSVGVAIQDLCAAERVLEGAKRLGLGIPLS
ncbi:MAG: hypothetical protein N2C14_21715, partial [Planctomycetales bacterium]